MSSVLSAFYLTQSYQVIRHSGGTDHSIDQTTIDRNDSAKDNMRAEAIERRIDLNNS